LIPKGCAHAFQTLKPDTVVEYFVTEYYSPEKERGIRWDDPSFKVKWPVSKVTVSEKDKSWPLHKK
jgi:dTDP-4-dehydrorhamnose 3,5-epimerase